LDHIVAEQPHQCASHEGCGAAGGDLGLYLCFHGIPYLCSTTTRITEMIEMITEMDMMMATMLLMPSERPRWASPRCPAAPAVLPSPRSIRSFSSLIRSARLLSRAVICVPTRSICLVKFVSVLVA